ncbi:phage tail protein I [Methylobacterium ajmalii]|uniref:Phage tail protein I n=1 Tax=Methylobacterium ajmalii TaxID=2738439 RepID=A0ABV0A5Z1_9HYPH
MTQRLLDHVVPATTPYNTRLLANNVERLLELDAEVIRSLWNPETCPIEHLPYLAWALSVDLWNPNWPEVKKRSVVANALGLHQLKGTQEGISRHLTIAGATLHRVIAPPARGFYTPAMTDESRRAWLEGLPQVRIYPYLTKRTSPQKRAFYRGSTLEPRSFYGHAFQQASDGPALYGRKATFFDQGIEVPAHYDVLQDPGAQPAERVRILGTNRKRSFFGRSFFNAAHYQASQADSQVVSIRLDGAASRQYATLSGMNVTDVNPERIYQTRIAPKGRKFFGRRGGFYQSTYAPHLIFDRVTILDPTRLKTRKKVRTFWGHARYGIAPFTAELKVEIPMQRPAPRRGRFMTGYWKAADMTPLTDALNAITVSKSFRDTILVDTEVHRRVRLSDGLPLGSFKLGEMRSLA